MEVTLWPLILRVLVLSYVFVFELCPACVVFWKRGSRAGEGRQHEDDIVNFVSYPSDTREARSLLKVLLSLLVLTM